MSTSQFSKKILLYKTFFFRMNEVSDAQRFFHITKKIIIELGMQE